MTLTTPRTGYWADMPHHVDNWVSGWQTFQGGLGNFAWGTANRAIYVPIRVPRACVVKELGWVAYVTAAGNCDVGIYNAAGTRLVSTGSTANTSVSVTRAIDVTDTTLTAGLYYLALNNDTTTDTFASLSVTAPTPAAWGVLTQAVGAVTLPATATWAVDNALTFVPTLAAFLVTEVS